MSKKTEQTEIAQATNQPYKAPLSVHLYDKDHQYLLKAHGLKDASGDPLKVQDPTIGVAYHEVELENPSSKAADIDFFNNNRSDSDSKKEKEWVGKEALINVVDKRGTHYLFDMPGRSNHLINNIHSDINETFESWSEDVANIIIICPLLNTTKSVEGAERQALEFQNLIPGGSMAQLHFNYLMYPDNPQFSSVANEFRRSDAIHALDRVGNVGVSLIRPEFTADLPGLIDNPETGKAWKFKDLLEQPIGKYARGSIRTFLNSSSEAWKKLFGNSLNIGPNDKGTLIIFLSAEGGVRKSTCAGSMVEFYRS